MAHLARQSAPRDGEKLAQQISISSRNRISREKVSDILKALSRSFGATNSICHRNRISLEKVSDVVHFIFKTKTRVVHEENENLQSRLSIMAIPHKRRLEFHDENENKDFFSSEFSHANKGTKQTNKRKGVVDK